MKRVGLRELHYQTGKIVDEAMRGDVILIERRGIVVAELRPRTTHTRARTIPEEHWEWLRSQPVHDGDSGRTISEDRDR